MRLRDVRLRHLYQAIQMDLEEHALAVSMIIFLLILNLFL